MNIHPVFVHIPIAFLMFYAVLELLPAHFIEKYKLQSTKLFLLVIGVIGAELALSTGESAEQLHGRALRPLIEQHAFFANLTTDVFLALAIAYILEIPFVQTIRTKLPSWIDSIFKFYLKILCRPVRILLALVGLVAVLITGTLGGAIAYGIDNDPFTSIIYHLLFK